MHASNACTHATRLHCVTRTAPRIYYETNAAAAPRGRSTCCAGEASKGSKSRARVLGIAPRQGPKMKKSDRRRSHAVKGEGEALCVAHCHMRLRKRQAAHDIMCFVHSICAQHFI